MELSEDDIRHILLRHLIKSIPSGLAEAELHGAVGISKRPRDPRLHRRDHFRRALVRTENESELEYEFRSIAEDAGIDTAQPYWMFETVVWLAVGNEAITSPEKRAANRHVKRGTPEEMRKVRAFLLSANRLRAYLQLLRDINEVSDAELAREIIARKRDNTRRGRVSLEDPHLERSEFRKIADRLGRYHKRHQELFSCRADLPTNPFAPNKSTLIAAMDSRTHPYNWAPDATEVNEVSGWPEEFQRVKQLRMPLAE